MADTSTVVTHDGNGSLTTSFSSAAQRAAQQRTDRKVLISRIVFLLGLACVGAGLGGGAFLILRSSETEQANVRFHAIADRALSTSREIVQRKRFGVVSMADTVAQIASNSSVWPFVTVSGFEIMANNIMTTSKARTLGLCPFVTPDQLTEFETFAYDFFYHQRLPTTFPNTTAVSSFGRGVWAKTKKSDTHPDGKIPVPALANTTWNSPNAVFAPILQHSSGAKIPVLMLNVNFEPTRGTMVDDMISCSDARATTTTNDDELSSYRCGVLTDMLNLASQEEGSGPDAIMMEPIYPAQDPRKLVGLIVSSLVWREALENVFATDVSGIDCVLRTPLETFTFGVKEGIPFVRGPGDSHDTNYDEYYTSIEIVTQGDFSPTSATYTLEIYPTQEFFNVYSTSNPIIGLAGAIGIIIVISLLFALYDCFVQKEFDANQELLEAKRRFVRFVSHEVRTPLNTVSMGLTLLQEELQTASGRSIVRHDQYMMTEKQRLLAKQEEEATLPRSVTVSQEDATEWIGLSEEILTNTQTAVEVLNDLLNYDKIKRGKLSLERSIIPIWTLIDKTVQEFKLMAAEKQVQLTLNYSSRLLNGSQHHPSRRGEEERTSIVPITSQLTSNVLDTVVIGDAIRISQVLRNLLSNGLKFTPENGRLSVHVNADLDSPSLDSYHKKNGRSSNPAENTEFTLNNGEKLALRSNGQVDIKVVDTGVGMTERQLKTVFNDGVQFSANKLQAGGGSGLGLFIAKGIVEQHLGTLEADSKGLGHGTTFTCTLPLYHHPTSTCSPVNSATQRTNNSSGGNDGDTIETPITGSMSVLPPPPPPSSSESLPQRVLVVDDSTPNRKLLIRLLQNRGHTCDGACNGKEAVEWVQKRSDVPYDTILLDHEMPIMTGPTACQTMRQLGCSSFIAGVTGNLLPEDVTYFKMCGANAVLPKPFKMATLEQLWMEYGVTGSGPAGDHNINELPPPNLISGVPRS